MKFASMEFVAFDSADVIATSGEVSFWKGKNMFAIDSVIRSFNQGSQLQLEGCPDDWINFFHFDEKPQDNFLWGYAAIFGDIDGDEIHLDGQDFYHAVDKDDILEWITANNIQ